ncbi:MAG: hypothetical protein NTY05_03965 [Rhodocyclales bacterium]|nr:hypothetical protein [Rhodocyclales bacterium]
MLAIPVKTIISECIRNHRRDTISQKLAHSVAAPESKDVIGEVKYNAILSNAKDAGLNGQLIRAEKLEKIAGK